MANLDEPSSALTVTSSNESSSPPATPDAGNRSELASLTKLSRNLERLLDESDFDCSDADIVVDGSAVGVHRCILSARSQFFRELFAGEKSPAEKLRYEMADLVPGGKVGREALGLVLGYLYAGKIGAGAAAAEAAVCVDGMCAHDACRPAVNFAVEVMYASSAFRVSELVAVFQRRLLNFVDKALVEDVITILLVAFCAKLGQLQSHCIQRVARSDLSSITLEKEIPGELVNEIKSIRRNSQPKEGNSMEADAVHAKRIRRIHRALDSDDVELVKLLLSESGITLDDAYALHYAAAYCDSKVVAEVLELGSADVNLKDVRGCTPLHVASMRREPTIVVSLLRKGASALETTADGQNAVSICRRMTRAKDYHAKSVQGQESNKDRLCVDILEREIRRNPFAGDKAVTSPADDDGLCSKLLYLENRVAFARLLFPSEAKVVMKIAQAEAASEFIGISASRSSSNLREVDLNETPTTQNKRLRSRMDALAKTVELGRRYFPHCSQVLDKFMEDDLPDLFNRQKGSEDEQKIKRIRFCELKEDVRRAFGKDKAESGRSGLCSSSSSSSSFKGDAKRSTGK